MSRIPKRKVKKHTEEFKQSSAKLAATSEQPISKTAQELGVNVNTLHGWVGKYERNTIKDRQASDIDVLSEELRQLKKENKRLIQGNRSRHLASP